MLLMLRTDALKRSFGYSGVKIWNDLRSQIRNLEPIYLFIYLSYLLLFFIVLLCKGQSTSTGPLSSALGRIKATQEDATFV